MESPYTATRLAQECEETQREQLAQSAAATQDLTERATQTADMAHQASGMANSASELASQGGQAVGRVVETKQKINQSSQKISEIISVIDGIAFQTNILALNAAPSPGACRWNVPVRRWTILFPALPGSLGSLARFQKRHRGNGTHWLCLPTPLPPWTTSLRKTSMWWMTPHRQR